MSAGPWLNSKYNFLGLGSIEFNVIGVGPLFDMLDLGFADILIIGMNYKVYVVSSDVQNSIFKIVFYFENTK